MPMEAKRTVVIDKHYLCLPVKDGAQMRRLRLSVDGSDVRSFNVELAIAKPDFYAFLDVNEWKGKTAVINIEPDERQSSILDGILLSDKIIDEESFYSEKFRPQFHYSPRIGWINDPNGLVYYDGEYHLFYQHNPYGLKWGNMHWGHAMSKDLVHWQELPEAIYPDEMGTVFSGSAIVDQDNTSRLSKGKEKTILAFYTAAGEFARPAVPFTQCIAYSNDKGRTWEKYERNPVLPNKAPGNRDPKVVWHKASKQWIMALYLDQDTFGFFGSSDLKKWSHLSDLKLPGFHECPDLFEMPVDDDPKKMKWVFMSSYGGVSADSPKCWIGNFDGKSFTPESGPFDLDHGGVAYAAQTFSDIPPDDGRRIYTAWASRDGKDPAYHGNPFTGHFWFPRSLTIRTTSEGLKLCQKPVKEIEKLYTKSHMWKEIAIKPGENILSDIKHDLLDIQAVINPGTSEEVGFTIRGAEIKFNNADQILTVCGKSVGFPVKENKLQLRILADRTSVEVFSSDGTFAMSRYFMPIYGAAPVSIYSKGDDAKAEMLKVQEIKSIWK